MTETQELAGRTAVIVGGGRGIGKAIAQRFAASGARLVIGARSGAEIDQVAGGCRQAGAEAYPIVVDVASWDQVEALSRRSIELLGHVDVLVNCAGAYGPIGLAETNNIQAWVRAVEINLIGTFHLAQAFIPHFKERRGGKVLLLGGGGAAAPLPFFSAYAASKAGVARLADTLAEELRAFNVQINVIAPGLVDTSLQDEVLAAGQAAGPLFERVRQARETGKGAVSPDVTAALAVFLASPQSGALTGKLIAAPYDPWQTWIGDQAIELNASPLYAIRRIDPFTIKPWIGQLS